MKTVGLLLNHLVRHKMTTLVIAVGIFCSMTTDAHAYFDPASGSSIIQIIVGVFLAGAMTFKVWFRRTRRVVLRILGKASDSSGTDG